MPKNTVNYEWVIEYVDKHDDIIDIDHSDDLDYVLKTRAGFVPGNGIVRVDLALVRDYGNNEEGLIERGYAYISENGINPHFCCWHKVPARFVKQVSRKLEEYA